MGDAKAKAARMKPQMSPIPCGVLAELGLAMSEGALKYGRHNWRNSRITASTYYDALMRHIMAYWEGESTDPDSGLSHLVKAMACLVVWRDAEMCERITDDRPRKTTGLWVLRVNEIARKLVEKHNSEKGH